MTKDEYRRQWRLKNRQAGLCRCGRERHNNTTLCLVCIESRKKYAQKRKARNARLGLCFCGRTKERPERAQCDQCQARCNASATAHYKRVKDELAVNGRRRVKDTGDAYAARILAELGDDL